MVDFRFPETVPECFPFALTPGDRSMKKFIWTALAVVTLFMAPIGLVRANSALALDYVVTDTGQGVFQYDFTLTLTDPDGSWQPGQGFGWFIFGDALRMTSPIDDFYMDASQFPVGPWTGLSSSVGEHNGPTFSNVLDMWVPFGIGDNLQWTGFSTVFLDQDQLLFSSILTSGGAPIIEFEIATLDQGP
jgi:hypothetical protein